MTAATRRALAPDPLLLALVLGFSAAGLLVLALAATCTEETAPCRPPVGVVSFDLGSAESPS